MTNRTSDNENNVRNNGFVHRRYIYVNVEKKKLIENVNIAVKQIVTLSLFSF